MVDPLERLAKFIESRDGQGGKPVLSEAVAREFELTNDRSLYFNSEFAVRFSSSGAEGFSNTVLSLSNLRKYDHLPFVVCLLTPIKNYLFLANTTLIKKISHSSQALTATHIRGSFNGSDIARDLDGVANNAANLRLLFEIHDGLGFDGNLPRIVEATNGIVAKGKKFVVTEESRRNILAAPSRAIEFVGSKQFRQLAAELDGIVAKFQDQILIASLIENTNVRGRAIEFLIAGDDAMLRNAFIEALQSPGREFPAFKTENTLGDFHRILDKYVTETDVKTKIMILTSSPKAYNLDKVLEFLSGDHSIFLFYFVGIVPGQSIQTSLITMFQQDLLASTIKLRHWAGKNSRGVSQFRGSIVHDLIENPDNSIDVDASRDFLEELLAL